MALLDLYSDDSGEIQVGFNGDLLVARDADVVTQEIKFRLATSRGDWTPYPECGADLEALIGQPNSPQTGSLLESQVSRALTHDGFLRGELQKIQAVPLSRTQIAALITLELGDAPFTVPYTLDLREGRR